MDESGHKEPWNPAYRHPLEKGEVMQLCAGMPQVATRDLGAAEHDSLRALKRAFLRKAVRRGVVGFLVLGGVAYLTFILFQWKEGGLWSDLFAGALGVGGVIWGLFTLIQTVDLLIRRWILRRACDAGYVRVFEGTLNAGDFTDKTRRWLEKTGLVHDDAGVPNTIELYADHNVVHQINGEEPEDWVSVILTHAAAVPEDPLILDVPADWFPDAAEGCMQRRRQTATEHEEILTYADVGRRRLSQIPLLWGVPVFLALVFLMHKLLELDAALVAWVSGAIAAAITIYNVVHTRRKVNALLEDAEFGWIIILTPQRDSEDGHKESWEHGPATEFLPASETLWSFAGRPAAWRYGATFRPRS